MLLLSVTRQGHTVASGRVAMCAEQQPYTPISLYGLQIQHQSYGTNTRMAVSVISITSATNC